MKHFFLILSIFVFLNFISCNKKNISQEKRRNEVIVYTYDSFSGEWGSGPAIAKKFQDATGYTLTYVNCADAASILSKAITEKNMPASDILLGLDNNIAKKAREADVLESYKPNKVDSIINENIISSLGDDWILTPYDFSTFAIIYDTQSSVSAPKSLSDLTKKDYEKKLIIMDPRLSTPGLGFASWTLAVFGSEYESFWKNLKASILTMSPNWSSGYGLFTKGEAPLVISYTTSPAYHKYEDNSERYRALSFYDGHIMQVEGAGITKGAKNIVGAKAFLDFLISEDAQEEIPIGQWMYPANKNIVLPDCYSVSNLENVKLLSYNINELDNAIENIIRIISE